MGGGTKGVDKERDKIRMSKLEYDDADEEGVNLTDVRERDRVDYGEVSKDEERELDAVMLEVEGGEGSVEEGTEEGDGEQMEGQEGENGEGDEGEGEVDEDVQKWMENM